MKHSCCTDFTIHSECTSTGQAFRFTQSGTNSIMYGGTTSGDDLTIYANDEDAAPYIKLLGNSSLELSTAADIYLSRSGTDFITFSFSTDKSIIYGDNIADHDLELRANTSDTGSAILVQGARGMIFQSVDGHYSFDRHNSIANRFRFSDDLTVLDLYLYNNRQFKVSVDGDQIARFAADSGNAKWYGSDDTGDDLFIYANSSDNDPYIKLNGAGNIEFSCASGDIDFDCIEALNFRLENRTDDPDSPCVGQLWFRTDL